MLGIDEFGFLGNDVVEDVRNKGFFVVRYVGMVMSDFDIGLFGLLFIVCWD